MLYQKQSGQLRVISYASRGLKRSEKNYPAAKLEFLTLKWAITEKLHDYLYGAKFREIRKQQLNDQFVGFWVSAVRDKKVPLKSNLHTREGFTGSLSLLNW